MKNIKLLLVTLLICVSVILTACGESETPIGGDGKSRDTVSYTVGEKVTVADANGCGFTVVRPENCEKTVTDAAVSLNKAIMGIIGDLPQLKTDFGTKGANEILIGMTNRAESEKAAEGLGEKDFRILFEGTKIAIVGGSDAATAEAVAYFIENYISDNVLSVSYGENYHYEYVAARIKVNGADITEYKIYSECAPEALVTRVQEAIFNSTGTAPAVTDKKEGKYISLIADSSLETGYYMAKLQSDGSIRLEADTATGLYYSVGLFEAAIRDMNLPGETYSLSINESGAYPPAFELFGEEDSRYFLAETNKEALSYEIGEEIEFTISLLANDEIASCARFDWTMAGDDGQSSSGSESGISGMLTLKTTLENNGFVMVTVKAIGADGNEIDSNIRFSGAAGVHPELLTVSVPEPEDFDEYWEAALEEMMAVDPEIIQMEEIAGRSGFKAYEMKIACAGSDRWTGETYVTGYLTYPANASAKSLKIRATFQGYGVDTASPSYKDSYITFSVCGHSIEQGEDPSYYNDLKSNELKNYGWTVGENSDPLNVYFRYMLLRDLQALRFMKEYFGDSGLGLWNGDTIDLSGSSQGGFQVIALAALDKDIDSISAGVPWLCDIGGYTDGKKIKSSFRPDFADGLGYFDSANFASRITCNVSISAGLGDSLCPPAGVAAMYNALNCSKTITFGQNKTHSYNPPVGDKFTFSE